MRSNVFSREKRSWSIQRIRAQKRSNNFWINIRFGRQARALAICESRSLTRLILSSPWHAGRSASKSAKCRRAKSYTALRYRLGDRVGKSRARLVVRRVPGKPVVHHARLITRTCFPPCLKHAQRIPRSVGDCRIRIFSKPVELRFVFWVSDISKDRDDFRQLLARR